jgi:DNA-binding MarR family transcriptional regulator
MISSMDKFLKPTEQLRNLQLLEEISQDSSISQRKLSSRLGVALGVTNACLKKMVKKGHIKVKGINHKRIAYYLTPQGFTEKTRLAYHFLHYTVSYYINLKKEITSKLNQIISKGHRRILFYGAGEVMEVALVCLHETNLELLGIIDDSPDKQGRKIFNYTIQSAEAIRTLRPDIILVTSIKYQDRILESLKKDKQLKGIGFYLL